MQLFSSLTVWFAPVVGVDSLRLHLATSPMGLSVEKSI